MDQLGSKDPIVLRQKKNIFGLRSTLLASRIWYAAFEKISPPAKNEQKQKRIFKRNCAIIFEQKECLWLVFPPRFQAYSSCILQNFSTFYDANLAIFLSAKVLFCLVILLCCFDCESYSSFLALKIHWIFRIPDAVYRIWTIYEQKDTVQYIVQYSTSIKRKFKI